MNQFNNEFYENIINELYPENNIKNDSCCDIENNYYYDNGSYICKTCSSVIRYNDVYNNTEPFNKKFYKRYNYLMNILKEINGIIPYYENDKQNINTAIQIILQEINNKPINYLNIRFILKKHKLFNCYKFINYICDSLNNNTMNILINHQNKKLIIDEFLKFESIYNKTHIPYRKKKILSYNYILYQIFKKLKMNHLILRLNFPLLTKNEYHDNVFKEYFADFLKN